jgi:hypothetical protein
VVRGFSRRFYEALEAGSGAIELDPSDIEELGQESSRDSAHEPAEAASEAEDDYDLNTATNTPPLRTKSSSHSSAAPEDTSPVPKIDANGPKSTLPGAGS